MSFYHLEVCTAPCFLFFFPMSFYLLTSTHRSNIFTIRTKSAMLTFLCRCEQTCPTQCPLSGGEESSQVAEEEGLPCPSGTLTSQAAIGQVEMGPSRVVLRPPLGFEHITAHIYNMQRTSGMHAPPPPTFLPWHLASWVV